VHDRVGDDDEKGESVGNLNSDSPDLTTTNFINSMGSAIFPAKFFQHHRNRRYRQAGTDRGASIKRMGIWK